MKKTLKIMLVIAMLSIVVICMTACGKKEENKNEVANENKTTTVEVSRGTWNGNQYVNEFAKVKFNLPTGWEKYSDEQIAEMMNIGVEMLNEDQKKLAELAQDNALYGMVANNPSTRSKCYYYDGKTNIKGNN